MWGVVIEFVSIIGIGIRGKVRVRVRVYLGLMLGGGIVIRCWMVIVLFWYGCLDSLIRLGLIS